MNITISVEDEHFECEFPFVLDEDVPNEVAHEFFSQDMRDFFRRKNSFVVFNDDDVYRLTHEIGT